MNREGPLFGRTRRGGRRERASLQIDDILAERVESSGSVVLAEGDDVETAVLGLPRAGMLDRPDVRGPFELMPESEQGPALAEARARLVARGVLAGPPGPGGAERAQGPLGVVQEALTSHRGRLQRAASAGPAGPGQPMEVEQMTEVLGPDGRQLLLGQRLDPTSGRIQFLLLTPQAWVENTVAQLFGTGPGPADRDLEVEELWFVGDSPRLGGWRFHRSAGADEVSFELLRHREGWLALQRRIDQDEVRELLPGSRSPLFGRGTP